MPARPRRSPATRLPPAFYAQEVRRVAQHLLGKILATRIDGVLTRGRIVETEAYLARGDEACHAARGRTRRNEAMFAGPGRAYVYAIHSRWCFNVVAGKRGVPAAVLIRAIQPLDGLDAMRARRGRDPLRELARGPARLCEALAIDRALNFADLTRDERIWIETDLPPGGSQAPGAGQARHVWRRTRRIGVTAAHHRLLRYAAIDSPFVSGPRAWR